MKLLRIKAYQLFANYRKPMSFNYWDSYPLPPLSTVRGWFHYIVWNGNTDENRHYIPISMSIQGDFESVVYDLQTLIKFDRKRKEDNKPILEGFNKAFSKSPTYVANIYDMNLTIYIKAEEKYLEKFIENVFKIEYPDLGRKEDLLRIDSVKIIEPDLRDFEDEEHEINYGIYLNKYTADKFGIRGINYRMNFKYNGELLEKTGIRYFEKKDVVYIDNAILEDGEILFDEEESRIIDLVGDS
jgi:CRISPR-associated protein Cas5t